MSELFEKIFNSIYQVLIEDGLVSQHGVDEEEKKKKSFHKCISIFQSIRESSVDNEMNLKKKIKDILELLGIDAGDKKRLDEIFGLINAMRSIEHLCSAACTHEKFAFCVVMISRTESQRIVVQKRGENIEIQLDKFVF
jgi:hypothetical protein